VTEEPIRVLVVDDDFHVAHAHALGVSRVPGFVVVGEAHSCAEAVEAVVAHAPHLLLLDMYLPDGGGLDVVRELATARSSEVEPPDFLPVTAARDLDSVRSAMQLGAFYYLVKPFSFLALREQLEAYRSWTRQLSAATEASQEVVDSLFGIRSRTARRSARRPLPPTMAKVLDIVAAAPGPIATAEVADQLGASRPTAQRYLAELLRRQLVDLDLTYGTTGRPEHRYRPSRA
jgi:response regulator of citrate/malate metabolism